MDLTRQFLLLDGRLSSSSREITNACELNCDLYSLSEVAMDRSQSLFEIHVHRRQLSKHE
jgi:hypothetical protein